jgi:hypothetical protein
LESTLENQVQILKGLEEKIAQKVRGLKALENQIKTANGVAASIQHNLDELEKRGVKDFSLSWEPKQEEMYFSFGGRKHGVIDVFTDRGIVFVSEINKGILHVTPESAAVAEIEEETEGDIAAEEQEQTQGNESAQPGDKANRGKRKKRKRRRKVKRRSAFVFDMTHYCWVPKYYILLGRRQNTMDHKYVDGIWRFKELFKGAKCRFTTRMKRTITAYSLAAVGTSDFGVQSIIFGVLKAINDEIDLEISDEELANGIPSVKSLANWEYDLAAGCMATIINQINTDAKRMMDRHSKKLQEITLITDHGNRRGVDHFVKQIC